MEIKLDSIIFLLLYINEEISVYIAIATKYHVFFLYKFENVALSYEIKTRAQEHKEY